MYYNNKNIFSIKSDKFNNRRRGESSVNLVLILDSFFSLFRIYKKKKNIINKINLSLFVILKKDH